MQVKSIAECSKGSLLQYFWPSLEHSAILLTFIKPPFVIKIFVLSILSSRFTQVLLYFLSIAFMNLDLLGLTSLDLTWSWVYFSIAEGVPGTGVGSRFLECLKLNLHASLFSGSLMPRLHIFMSALRHTDQVSSPSSFGTRNCHPCGRVYAWRGACNMSIPPQMPSAESCCHLVHS